MSRGRNRTEALGAPLAAAVLATLLMAGCSDNLPLQPTAAAPVAAVNPSFSSYIVVLKNSIQVRGIRTGSSFGSLMASRSGAAGA